jgi:uracil-DNA glycosylase
MGLAPGAHGSNRTGRMFTGARSGVFLYQALYDAGFANQPTAVNRDDGLRLTNVYIAAAARCAPPDNKPLPSEILNCRGYLEREIDLLRPRAVLALGKIGWDVFLGILKHRGAIPARVAYRFAHGAEVDFPAAGMRLFGVYHPSQQNTQTGLLTPAMYAKVLRRVRRFLEREPRLNTESTERTEKREKILTQRRRGR